MSSFGENIGRENWHFGRKADIANADWQNKIFHNCMTKLYHDTFNEAS